jgi:hypothetical protein
VFQFRFQPINRSLPFPFSVCSKQNRISILRSFLFPNINMRKTATSVCLLQIYLCCCFKGKPEAQATLIWSWFAHHAKRKIDVCPFIEEESTEVIHLQTDLPIYACAR